MAEGNRLPSLNNAPHLKTDGEFFLPLRLSCKERLFSKTYPSFLTVKEGSTSHLGLLSSGEKKETALLGTVYAPPVPPLREGPYPIPKP